MYLHIPYMVKYHAKNPPIQEIFRKDKNGFNTNKGLMYQDILCYPLRTGNVNFKLRQIGMWLLQHNQELINEYTGTKGKTPQKARYENRKGRIEALLEDLIGLQLLIKNMGKAEKVDTTVSFYSLTGSGYFVSLLIKRKNLRELLNKSSIKGRDYQKELDEINDKLYEFIQSNLKQYDSYHTIALAKEYEIYKDHGWFDIVLYLVESLLNDGNEVKTAYEAIELASRVNLVHRPEIHRGLHKLALKALNSLDEKSKFAKRVEIKALLEDRILEQVPTREWEDLRLHHLNDYSIVMLYGKCHKCNWEDFVEADPISFINTHIKNSIHSTCPKCGETELHVTTELPSNRVLSLMYHKP
jgi:hypothetical protein